MYTYSYFVKLNYEYCDGSSFPRNITYDYQDYLFQDEEYNANIKILEDFKLEISDIIAENDDMGFHL